MFKNWKNNLNRHDLPVFRQICHRLGQEKASVFLEFAFALPLLMTLSLFILELCFFWDTTIMANHAAFSLSRIAKVNAYHGVGTTPDNPYPRVNIGSTSLPADQAVTAFYMMTSTFAWDGASQTGSDVNFIDFFTINKPLFQVTVDSQANIFERIAGGLLQKLVSKADQETRKAINGVIKEEMNKIFSGDFGKQMNTRFNMALQRAKKGCTKTTVTVFSDSLAFPSDDSGVSVPPGGNYSDPEIVKVSINYPLHKGGWLYTVFSYWGKKDGSGNTIQPVAVGTHSMLVEPSKRDLDDYFAKDSGDSDIDPDKLKKEAEKRAQKIINDTSTYVDDWTEAVIHRVHLEKHYGGMKKAKKHSDFRHAVSDETYKWNKIKSKVDQFEKIVKDRICKGKRDTAFFCTTTDFTKCARAEHKRGHYCTKVGAKIKRTADKYNLYWKHKGKFPHYVKKKYVNPYHSHGICGKQHFCP